MNLLTMPHIDFNTFYLNVKLEIKFSAGGIKGQKQGQFRDFKELIFGPVSTFMTFLGV